MENKKSFYITTPIYYPSANLHIGHALTTVMADTISRYKRMRDYDVWFLTGSDEHGQKIERSAQIQGVEPLVYVDQIVENFKKLWERLYISNDDFIRTTDERHKKVVQEIFTKIYEQGDIYRSEYQGQYCTPCETFFAERQLIEGNCPDCGRPVETLQEESYFFKMSKYEDQLLRHIEEHPEFIQPVSRRNEMINFIKQGLDDLCVSRTTFNWGIPVPFNEKHVIYVWFDALTNYISALNYNSENDQLYQRFWPCDIHLVGKDIVRFHTIIWPTILMAAGLPLPKQIYGHGWLLLDSGKMSKSKGNVVDPNELIDKYGADPIRYFLLREIPAGADGYYSEEALIQRYNTDLANDFGNLISRTIAMVEKYFQGVIPAAHAQGEFDQELKELAARTPLEAEKFIEKMDFANALGSIWKLVGRANKYIDETTPWILAKDEDSQERLGTVLYNLLEVIRITTILNTPFMPTLAAKVSAQIGLDLTDCQWAAAKKWGLIPEGGQVQRGAALFPRIDPKSIDLEEEKVEPIEPIGQEITIDEFAKIDLRVVEVLKAEKVPKTDKLLELQVQLDEEVRTVVAGLAENYQPQDLIGKRIILVANLKPAKLRGITSQGMILAVSSGEKMELLEVKKDLPTGSRVK